MCIPLVRLYDAVLPNIKVASLGELVIFQCNALVTQWFLNDNSLPDSVYSFTNYFSNINLIIVVIQNDSYFGEYRCMGETWDNKIAFYDIGRLKHKGTQQIFFTICNNFFKPNASTPKWGKMFVVDVQQFLRNVSCVM